MHSLCVTNNHWWASCRIHNVPTISIDILSFLTSGSSQSHSLFTWYRFCKFGLVVGFVLLDVLFSMHIVLQIIVSPLSLRLQHFIHKLCVCGFFNLSFFFCVCFSLFLLISLFYCDFCSIYYIANSKGNHWKY